jgi:hypothetical protein
VMDNAGGHGTREAREAYITQLLENYNIEIIQQSACSPEVNAPDLGIWMSVQSAVERMNREQQRDPDGLAFSVQEAWQRLPENTIHWVFDRMPIVLQLIVMCGGDNINVEERRGRHSAAVAGCSSAGVKKNYERNKFSQGVKVGSWVRDTHSLVLRPVLSGAER